MRADSAIDSGRVGISVWTGDAPLRVGTSVSTIPSSLAVVVAMTSQIHCSLCPRRPNDDREPPRTEIARAIPFTLVDRPQHLLWREREGEDHTHRTLLQQKKISSSS